MLSVALFVFVICIANGIQAIQLPKPKGPLNVGTIAFELTDDSRLDPFAPTPENRSIQVSVHYPTSDEGSRLPFATYLPTLTAQAVENQYGIPAGSLQNISTQAHLNASILDGGESSAPIILFSPGGGISRLLYTTFVQDLASEGYIVISIDHPRDASIVELSDGRVILFNISGTPEIIALDVSVRAADSRFVLDELARPSANNAFAIPGLKNTGLGGRPVGFFGHSLGGATAATTMALDKRVVGGVNMDGSFQGPDVLRGFDRPFVILARKGHNRTTDATWEPVWEKLLGFKREIEINETVHLTFTDGPTIGDLLQIPTDGIFGTIQPQRFEEIRHAYLTAFFDFALKGKEEKLLDGLSPKFPDVSFVP